MHTEKQARKRSLNLIWPLWLALISALPINSLSANDKAIHFACARGPASTFYQELETVLHSFFEAHSYSFSMRHYNYASAPISQLYQQGAIDGECIQRGEYLKWHPELPLIRVEPPVTHLETWIWGPPTTQEPDKTTLTLGYVDGIIAPDTLLGYPQTKAAESLEALLADYKSGAIDYFVFPEISSPYFKKALSSLQFEKLFRNNVRANYLYIHKRYQHLVPYLQQLIQRSHLNTQNPGYPGIPKRQHSSELLIHCDLNEQSPLHQQLSDIFNKALKPQGYSARFIRLPSARAGQLIADGILDGLCARGPEFWRAHSDSVFALPIPLTKIPMGVWSTRNQSSILNINQFPDKTPLCHHSRWAQQRFQCQ